MDLFLSLPSALHAHIFSFCGRQPVPVWSWRGSEQWGVQAAKTSVTSRWTSTPASMRMALAVARAFPELQQRIEWSNVFGDRLLLRTADVLGRLDIDTNTRGHCYSENILHYGHDVLSLLDALLVCSLAAPVSVVLIADDGHLSSLLDALSALPSLQSLEIVVLADVHVGMQAPLPVEQAVASAAFAARFAGLVRFRVKFVRAFLLDAPEASAPAGDATDATRFGVCDRSTHAQIEMLADELDRTLCRDLDALFAHVGSNVRDVGVEVFELNVKRHIAQIPFARDGSNIYMRALSRRFPRLEAIENLDPCQLRIAASPTTNPTCLVELRKVRFWGWQPTNQFDHSIDALDLNVVFTRLQSVVSPAKEGENVLFLWPSWRHFEGPPGGILNYLPASVTSLSISSEDSSNAASIFNIIAQNLPNLQTLELQLVWFSRTSDENPIPMADGVLERLSLGCPRLVSFSLTNGWCPLPINTLDVLATFPMLEVLELREDVFCAASDVGGFISNREDTIVASIRRLLTRSKSLRSLTVHFHNNHFSFSEDDDTDDDGDGAIVASIAAFQRLVTRFASIQLVYQVHGRT
jgi:hypothetical protein